MNITVISGIIRRDIGPQFGTPAIYIEAEAGPLSPMPPAGLMYEIEGVSEGQPLLIVLAGDAFIDQPYQHLVDLLRLAHNQGYTVEGVFSGQQHRGWMRNLDYLTVSPRPGLKKRDWEQLETTMLIGPQPGTSIVARVRTEEQEADLEFADRLYQRYHGTYPIYFTVDPEEEVELPADGEAGSSLDWLFGEVMSRGMIGGRILP